MFGPQIGRWIADFVGLGRAFEIAWNILRWPVILFLGHYRIAMIYYFTPDVEQSWKWITPGSVFAVALWLIASLGFSYYVNNFGAYDKTYGTIGAIIVLLTWMYVSGLVILDWRRDQRRNRTCKRRGQGAGRKNRRISSGKAESS